MSANPATTSFTTKSPSDDLPESPWQKALAAPFEAHEVKAKPAVVSGNRALALHYVDARVIQDRLDDVLGVEGWQDDYECLPDGSVVCRLKLRLGDDWLTKVDVGSPSEQPDGGDRLKAAFSDALKRAAVKFGIGRYLYRLPQQWVDYDSQKRQFTKPPQLPAWALPVGSKGAAPAPAAKPATPAPAAKPKKQDAPPPPANGQELVVRVLGFEKRMASIGLCKDGELVVHLVRVSPKDWPDDIGFWDAPSQIEWAVKECRKFEADRQKATMKKGA